MTEHEEQYDVNGEDLVSTIKKILAEGNARRIIIKSEKDETVVEFPLTIGVAGVLLAPLFAAIGAIAAIATRCKVIVVRK